MIAVRRDFEEGSVAIGLAIESAPVSDAIEVAVARLDQVAGGIGPVAEKVFRGGCCEIKKRIQHGLRANNVVRSGSATAITTAATTAARSEERGEEHDAYVL